ncbi:MAG TPA: 2OG-Fe(II) oxygenase [Acetobacteraceae bacterium]|jgi:peroxiredoxin|nr:2OG-Fe(II) oxygenase [Acetobacteraceae bacterium]
MTDSASQLRTFALKGHIQPGDPAPWWKQGRHKFVFDRAGGRYIVLSFYGNAGDATGQTALRALHENRHFVDDGKASFFGICMDPRDKSERNVEHNFSAVQFVWDFDAETHRAYGVAHRIWIVLDPMLRVVEVLPFSADGAEIPHLLTLLERLPPPSQYAGDEAPVPVLLLPNVFEPAFCRYLIDRYEANGGRESGFMREVGGKAVESYDPEWKRRRDYIITDPALIELIKARMGRRVGVMLQKAYRFTFSRMERHLIACYAEEDGGHFGPHRDDVVRATEHRQFAVSINLNDDFDGGAVSFPEFSPRQFKAPIGTALIFAASVLHRVSKVTRGRRYAFLPFLHDEAAEKLRLANLQFLTAPGN